MPLPVHAGAITSAGYCGIDHAMQITWGANVLALFGLWFLLALMIAVYRRSALWPGSVFLRFCIVYGAASLALSPLLGAAINRLISYSWPLLLIAIPILIAQLGIDEALPWRAIIAINAALSWAIFFTLGRSQFIVLIAALAIYLYCWIRIRPTLRITPVQNSSL
jgi:hypothetical protein